MHGVGKAFGPRWVLRGVDLEVGSGETVALVGPNGSGKTTLLRIASSLSRPTEGTVEVGGHDALRHPEVARADMGVLLQTPPLYDDMTPADHVSWWSRLHGVAPDAHAILAGVGLAGNVQHARTLSRGQRQRLALALATTGDPRLLVLDEPFAAMDDGGFQILKGLLKRRRRRSATLLSLHDRELANDVADRVLALCSGRLVDA